MKNLTIKNFLKVFSILAILTAVLLNIPSEANAQVPTTDQTFGECIGEALADYMNTLLDAKGPGPGQIPSNVKLLSPAFNMTSPTFNGIVDGMKQNGAQFNRLDGISGNVYNVGGKPISYYMENVRRAFPGARFVITETGTYDRSEQGVIDLAEELQDIGDDVDGALLFNGLNTNGGWSSHAFTEDQIKYICGGDCRGKKIGLNTANMFGISNDDYYRQAGNGNLNAPMSLEIADSGQYSNVVKGIQNSIDNGITPIIRIGVGESAFGFNDPSTYAAFLSQIGNQFPGVEIFAIAGPNEPDLEGWLQPACYSMIVRTAEFCGGPLDFEPVPYRGEIIGLSNGGQPWRLSAALSDRSGRNDIDTIADRLTAKLIIQATGIYNHPDFDALTNNIVGTPGSIDTLVENRDEPFHIKTRLKQKPYMGSFTIPVQKPKDQTGFGEESYEDWTRRLFTTSSEDGGIRFGTKAKMPATSFLGCLQRPACDPSVDTCLKASNGKELCGAGDDPSTCVSVGRLFTFTGEINHEEPADLQAIVRSRQNAKSILLTPSPNQRTERTENRFADNFIYEDFAKANALSGYGVANATSIEEIVSKNQTDSEGSNRISNIAAPPPVSAQPFNPEEGVRNYMSLSATQNDGSTYNVSYRYCVAHTSPCGMGDISTVINGQEINIWARTSTPEGVCLEPGWGGAPMFVGVSLPFTVTASSRGRWVGESYCRAYDTVSASCTVSIDPVTEKLISTCGEVPEPLPLDCRDCPSWAPADLCEPIIAPSLTQENRCADGRCETGPEATIEEINYDEDRTVRFDFSWLPAFLTNIIGFYSVGCTTVSDEFGNFRRLQCLFNNQDYLLYAYAPSGFAGDLQAYRSRDLEIHNALYDIKGRTNRYFDNMISSKHPVSFTLGFEDAAARGGERAISDFEFRSSLPSEYFDPKDESFIHLGLKGDLVRTMNVEYYELFQPQMSGYCLGIAFENFKGEFDADVLKHCNQYDFVPQGLSFPPTSGELPPADPTAPPPTYSGTVESALQSAASANGIPYELLKTILEIEAGPNYSIANQCTRNSYTATGPFQIIDSTADGLTSPTEKTEWNIKRWGENTDYTTDGRCSIDIASTLAGRLLRQNVGGVNIDASNVSQIKRAAQGYYGSCQPDEHTNAAFGFNISYCDYVIYRMNLCPALAPSCDGDTGGSIASEQKTTPNSLAASLQANKVLEENLLTNMTEQDRMQFRMALLADIEEIVQENKSEIDKNNGELPTEAKNQIMASVTQLTARFKSKYNL